MKNVWVVALLMLSACGEKADDRICSTPPSSNLPGDWMGCAHKWAYRLAGAKESVPTVADAVTIACNDTADYAARQVPGTKEEQAARFSALLDFTSRAARWRVVQARAGHCEVP